MYFRLAIVGLTAAALALAAATAAHPMAVSANPSVFTDPAGDNGAAPDITDVSVGNDAAGAITLAITTNQQALPSTATIVVLLDTDMNASTGVTSLAGADYGLTFSGGSQRSALFTLSQQGPAPVNAPSLRGGDASGVATITINAGDLGHTKGFNFWIKSVDGANPNALGHYDNAPDHGAWTYQLVEPPPLTLTVKQLVVGRARAGDGFAVVMLVARSDGADFELMGVTVTCTASINGKRLALYGSVPPLVLTPAICQWRLPKRSRGQTITGSITVTDGAATVSRPFKARIT